MLVEYKTHQSSVLLLHDIAENKLLVWW